MTDVGERGKARLVLKVQDVETLCGYRRKTLGSKAKVVIMQGHCGKFLGLLGDKSDHRGPDAGGWEDAVVAVHEQRTIHWRI